MRERLTGVLLIFHSVSESISPCVFPHAGPAPGVLYDEIPKHAKEPMLGQLKLEAGQSDKRGNCHTHIAHLFAFRAQAGVHHIDSLYLERMAIVRGDDPQDYRTSDTPRKFAPFYVFCCTILSNRVKLISNTTDPPTMTHIIRKGLTSASSSGRNKHNTRKTSSVAKTAHSGSERDGGEAYDDSMNSRTPESRGPFPLGFK